jgi:hypothetical protein
VTREGNPRTSSADVGVFPWAGESDPDRACTTEQFCTDWRSKRLRGFQQEEHGELERSRSCPLTATTHWLHHNIKVSYCYFEGTTRMFLFEYKNYTIYPTPLFHKETASWQIHLTIKYKNIVKVFENEDILFTKPEAVFYCIKYGKELIDHGIKF